MSQNEKLSVPKARRQIPRQLTDDELSTLVRVADALCGPSGRVAPPSEQDDFARWLDVALATRSDSFDVLMGLVAEASQVADLVPWLRHLHDTRGEAFQVLSTVLAGAYLMVPVVREAVGYPGQHRDVPGLEEAADEIGDGILDPVIERGHFFVPTPGVQ
jgi:hypothetical protein